MLHLNQFYKKLIFQSEKIPCFITLFYTHKKKVLDSRKFWTYGFQRTYVFWDVLNTIWLFWENTCLYVDLSLCMSRKFCGHCNSRTNVWKLMKLNIPLHLEIIWNWLDFRVHSSTSGTTTESFPQISWSLHLWFYFIELYRTFYGTYLF